MAEETLTENPAPVFDEEKLSNIITKNIKESMTALEEKLTPSPKLETPQEEPDFWDAIIDPKVNKKVSHANLQAELAQDKVDFYTSEDWLTEAEEWLVEEDPIKRKEEKAQLRAQVEKISTNLAKSGRGLPRADIFNAVLGEKIKKDRIKYTESIGKKNKAKEESELIKAQRGVDITSTLADFTPESVHRSKWEDVEKTYGGVAF